MVPPLIICVFMGAIALACVGTVVWQVSLPLAWVLSSLFCVVSVCSTSRALRVASAGANRVTAHA